MGKTRIVIHGAAGKMGQRLVALAAEDPQLQIVAAVESENHPSLGEDVGVLAGDGSSWRSAVRRLFRGRCADRFFCTCRC